MYEAYFGLIAKPFSISPDPAFLYWAPKHRMAYTMLEYGIINRSGFTVVTGEIGAGKTTLIRHLLNQMPSDVEVGFLEGIQGSDDRLLDWLLLAFRQDTSERSDALAFQCLRSFLELKRSEGKRAVLIVDEAQTLKAEDLDRLRLLSNIDYNGEELLQIVLSGQPNLKARLTGPDMTQFVQRITSDFHLGLLSPNDVPGYIFHRLSVAGAERKLFSASAIDAVMSASDGTPRLINVICDTSLLYAYAAEETMVSSEIVRQVLDDKGRYSVFPTISPRPARCVASN